MKVVTMHFSLSVLLYPLLGEEKAAMKEEKVIKRRQMHLIVAEAQFSFTLSQFKSWCEQNSGLIKFAPVLSSDVKIIVAIHILVLTEVSC